LLRIGGKAVIRGGCQLFLDFRLLLGVKRSRMSPIQIGSF
jgi:hypothetical protein